MSSEMRPKSFRTFEKRATYRRHKRARFPNVACPSKFARSPTFPRPLIEAIKELKQATFLCHARKPKVIISHATTVVSQIFKLILYTSDKIFTGINGSMKTN